MHSHGGAGEGDGAGAVGVASVVGAGARTMVSISGSTILSNTNKSSTILTVGAEAGADPGVDLARTRTLSSSEPSSLHTLLTHRPTLMQLLMIPLTLTIPT